MAEHSGVLNDQLRKYGAGELITKGVCRRTITLALRDAGLHAPYDYSDNSEFNSILSHLVDEKNRGGDEVHSRRAEMEWAFADSSDQVMDAIADEWIAQLAEAGESTIDNILDAEKHTEFGRVGLFDEDEILLRVEKKLEEGDMPSDIDVIKLRGSIESRRRVIAEKLRDVSL